MRRDEQTRSVSISRTVAVGKSLLFGQDLERTQLQIVGNGITEYRIDGGTVLSADADWINGIMRHPTITSDIELVGNGGTISVLTTSAKDVVEVDTTVPFLTDNHGNILVDDQGKWLTAS